VRDGVVDTIHPAAGIFIVTPSYFSSLSIPIMGGREFNAADTTDPTPMIVSQALARQRQARREAVGSDSSRER
jgi:hypothetical protein